jgi:hypothetical protein
MSRALGGATHRGTLTVPAVDPERILNVAHAPNMAVRPGRLSPSLLAQGHPGSGSPRAGRVPPGGAPPPRFGPLTAGHAWPILTPPVTLDVSCFCGPVIQRTEHSEADLPDGWYRHPPPSSPQQLGDQWVSREELVVLQVPSVVVPCSYNYFMNTTIL